MSSLLYGYVTRTREQAALSGGKLAAVSQQKTPVGERIDNLGGSLIVETREPSRTSGTPSEETDTRSDETTTPPASADPISSTIDKMMALIPAEALAAYVLLSDRITEANLRSYAFYALAIGAPLLYLVARYGRGGWAEMNAEKGKLATKRERDIYQMREFIRVLIPAAAFVSWMLLGDTPFIKAAIDKLDSSEATLLFGVILSTATAAVAYLVQYEIPKVKQDVAKPNPEPEPETPAPPAQEPTPESGGTSPPPDVPAEPDNPLEPVEKPA